MHGSVPQSHSSPQFTKPSPHVELQAHAPLEESLDPPLSEVVVLLVLGSGPGDVLPPVCGGTPVVPGTPGPEVLPSDVFAPETSEP